MDGLGRGQGRIVVGVDGSACSKAALGWALEKARLSGGQVEVVNACPPVAAGDLAGKRR